MPTRAAAEPRVVGDVIGFALRWDGQHDGVVWISGDTVLYPGVLEVAERLSVDVALVHLGAVRFAITGPLRYTMTGADAVELCRRMRPHTTIPVHYEGWRHFQEDRAAFEHALADAPDVAATVRWATPGQPLDIAA
jgi:L-ascorbate metabolism protein UlaG (beta-lactamase superfamily)